MNKQKKEKKEQVNTEFLVRQKEQKRSADMYSEDYYGPSLFPAYFYQNPVSDFDATEQIQGLPITTNEVGVYDHLFSYRLNSPIVPDEDLNIKKS